MFNCSKKPLRKHIDFEIHIIEVEQFERRVFMKHNLNHYVKNQEARAFIRFFAAIGYILLAAVWWAAYGAATILEKILCYLAETIYIAMQAVLAFKHKLKLLHKRLSYFEMIVIAVGGTVAILIGIAALYIFVLAMTLMAPPSMW